LEVVAGTKLGPLDEETEGGEDKVECEEGEECEEEEEEDEVEEEVGEFPHRGTRERNQLISYQHITFPYKENIHGGKYLG
jgi:hypothetical protein